MKPKLVPSATDILRTVREVTSDMLAPALTGGSERSAAATAVHMLRYVERLIDQQGQTLLDEKLRLRKILPAAAAWLARQPGGSDQSKAILAACNDTRAPDIYVTLVMMQDEVAQLRQFVCDLLLALQAAGDARDAEGEAVHQSLRDYIRWQLSAEGELVEPAFLGHGPRR